MNVALPPTQPALQLRFAVPDDADAILTILDNPAMAKYSPVDDISADDFRALLRRNPTSFHPMASYYRLVATLSAGENTSGPNPDPVVGTILVKCEDPNRGQVEIGYAVKADQQALGIGHAMVARACQLLFAKSTFTIIWAKVHKDNAASIRILTKVGFTERWLEPTGDIVVYCLDK